MNKIKNRYAEVRSRLRKYLLAGCFIVITFIFCVWPAWMTFWASDVHESTKSDAPTEGQFAIMSDIFTPLGVLFTGLALWGAWALLQETKKQNELVFGFEVLKESRKSVIWQDRDMTSIIKCESLLCEAGRSLDELMDNLRRAEDAGTASMFAKEKDFTIPFLIYTERCFQLFAACTPWTESFMFTMENVKYSPVKKYFVQALNRYEMMLAGAFYIAKGQEVYMPKAIHEAMFENTSEFVRESTIKLFKTYDLKGDGEYARKRLIEDIGHVKFVDIKGRCPEKLGLLLAAAVKDREGKINYAQACTLVTPEYMAARMLKLAVLVGWFESEDAAGPDFEQSGSMGTYCLTEKGRAFMREASAV